MPGGGVKFPDHTNAYYINRNEPDTLWCDWIYEEGQLLLKRYQDKLKEGEPLIELFDIHSISDERLVLIALIKSVEYPDKYRAIFHVYFRR